MRALLLAFALAAATNVQAAEPQAAPEPAEHSAWELDAFVGYGQLAFPWPDTAAFSWWNGGPAVALSVAYRGPHFTHPFLDFSWIPVLSSGASTYLPATNGATTTSNSSSALGLAIGPGWDIDWFRVRAGVGLYSVSVKSTVGGVSNSTSATTSASWARWPPRSGARSPSGSAWSSGWWRCSRPRAASTSRSGSSASPGAGTSPGSSSAGFSRCYPHLELVDR